MAAMLLSAEAMGQVTTARLTIGDADDVSCQTGSIPALTGGVEARVDLDLTYDAASGRLTLAVTNVSPIVAGEYNPLLVGLWLNLPDAAVTDARLVSQTAAGGATPDWGLGYGTDAFRAACMGSFDLQLSNGRGVHNGIGNAAAPLLGGPPGSQVIGPVTFAIQLAGPGLATITADAIAFGLSQNPPAAAANAAAKFQAAGQNAQESGFLGGSALCTCSSWSPGPARLGGVLEFCWVGVPECHGCPWISLTAGPTRFGPPFDLTAPIGFPPLAVIDVGAFSGRPECVRWSIPMDSRLAGLDLYFAILVAPPQPRPEEISFCGPLHVRIQS